ncbi:MAG: two-component system chemotaxis sensor kinase CheA [Planctomycetaceae bacterium]
MDDFDDVIKEFLVESYEGLDQLDRDLVALEDSPDDRDCLGSIFRAVHSMKGASGFLGLPKLERVAHVGENLLVPLRDGDLKFDHDIADGLLAMVDALRDILGNIEADGSEGATDYEELSARLSTLLDGGSSSSAEEVQSSAEVEASLREDEVSDVAAELNAPESEAETASQPKRIKAAPRPPKNSAPPAAEAEASAAKSTSEAPSKSSFGSTSLADSTVRIDVEHLNKLMNLVGELVLARNQILQFSSTTEDVGVIAASQRLNLITTELQEGVMKTRMQPISVAWSKLPRVVRDLSSSCNKKIEVRMEGADTELDKTILEAIKDPLTHIVRNSVDHGVESPDVRVANGKTPEGTLCLRAFHEGGQVNIEISDDGAGINVDRVREKAIEKGLVSADHAAGMNERELTNLILLPGFSTAATVTNVSGRGVGMDVVKTNIERIGGTVDIQSVPGEGTTLRIKIPLTLAIVPALIVTTGGDQYAIPQVSLLELVRLEGNRAKNDIEFIHDARVYRLRGNLLPLVYLDEQLGLRSPRNRDDYDEHVNIVVLQAEDRPFGLVVDAITDTQEIVVKPLGPHFKGITAYAGTTIMGDGTVALILDILGLAQKGNVLTEHCDRAITDGSGSSSDRLNDQQSMLVVDPGDGSRAAIDLSTVARLEEFGEDRIERSGHGEVVQYRGQIMPLIQLDAGYGGGYDQSEGESNCRHTVVYSAGERCVGVVVGKIVDIVHDRFEKTDGEMPSRCVIQDRVTEVIDLRELVCRTYPELIGS